MSTIAREFTKEQLQQIIETDHVQCGEASALARIALASLEAEAVCVIDQSNLDYLKSGADADVWPASRTEMGDVLLYRTAPPAPENAEPVAWLWSHRKHPSEVSLVRPEDDERAEGAHWSGWSCQALYAAPPAPVSVPDYPETLPCPVMLEPGLRFGKGVNTRTMLGALQRHAEYHAELEAMTPEERAEHDAGMKEFAAMLQGADGNSPVIPDGLNIRAVAALREAVRNQWLKSDDFADRVYWKSMHDIANEIVSAMLAAAPHQGAEPVTTAYKLQDGWVACSERMPDGMQTVITSNGFDIGQGWWDGEGWNSFDLHDVVPGEVTHWMPLPVAPQQEVK